MINVTFSNLASSHLLHQLDLRVKVATIVDAEKKSTLIMKKRIWLTVATGLSQLVGLAEKVLHGFTSKGQSFFLNGFRKYVKERL